MISTLAGGPVPLAARASDSLAQRPDANTQASARQAAVNPAAAATANAAVMRRDIAYGVPGKLATSESRQARDQRRGKEGPDGELPGEKDAFKGNNVNKDV